MPSMNIAKRLGFVEYGFLCTLDCGLANKPLKQRSRNALAVC
jgi:hypothetical protein